MPPATDTPAPERIYRHSVIVRVTHWINVVCLALLLFSGLMIFNAHPALDWGHTSDFERPWVQIDAEYGKDGEPVKGFTRIGSVTFDTTGLLGLSGSGEEREARAFPRWITIPDDHDLATARRWHFFFAWLFVVNGLVYLVSGLVRRHFSRDLVPTRPQLKGIGHAFIEHLRLRFPKGDEAKQYNVLQKLAYLGVIFVLLPVMVLAGMALSPALDALLHLNAFFGGRQSARTIHFIVANLLVLFVLVHVVMVLISGVWNNLRSMVTGRYDIEPADKLRD